MRKQYCIDIFLLTGIVLLFFSHILFTNNIFIYRDFYRYFYPTRYFVATHIKESIFPLWNPYILSGMPSFASLQTAILYPPSIFVYLLPFDLGFKLFIIIHYILAGCFMYILARDLLIRRQGAIVAAIVYTFSGYLLSLIELLTSLTSATWIPLVFLFYNRAINLGMRDEGGRRSFFNIILTGVALGLQFLGGEPTVLYATLIGLTLYTLARIVRNELFISRLSLLTYLPIAGIIGLSLVLFQVLPFLEMVSYSTRAFGIGYEISSQWSLMPHELSEFIIPFFCGDMLGHPSIRYGQQWLKSIYMGILPCFLILFYSLFSIIKERDKLIWVGLFLVFLLLALGKYTSLYKFLHDILPGLNMILYPVKFFCLSTFSGAILAGCSFSLLIKNIKEKKIFYYLLVIFNILIVSFFLFSHSSLFLSKFIQGAPYDKIDRILKWYSDIRANSFMVGIFLFFVNIIIFFFRKNLINLKILSPLLIIILLSDLFYFGYRLNPVIEEDFYKFKPKTLKIIKKDKSLYRILSATEDIFKYTKGRNLYTFSKGVQFALLPNTTLLYDNLYNLFGYESLYLRNYTVVLNRIKLDRLSFCRSLLDLLNLKYILSHKSIPKPINLKLVYNKEVKIYKNLTWLPRVFFLPRSLKAFDL